MHFSLCKDETMLFKGRKVVSINLEIFKRILGEAYSSLYSIHLGGTKMYRDLRKGFWREGMKRDIAHFRKRCAMCLRVKAKHQRLVENLQPLPILE